jgi:hypothetical protein
MLPYLFPSVFTFLMVLRHGSMKVNSKHTAKNMTSMVSSKVSEIVKWIIRRFVVQKIGLTFCDYFHCLDLIV